MNDVLLVEIMEMLRKLENILKPINPMIYSDLYSKKYVNIFTTTIQFSPQR